MEKVKTRIGYVKEIERDIDAPVGIIYVGVEPLDSKPFGFFIDVREDPGLVGNNMGIRPGDLVMATSVNGCHQLVQVLLRPKST